VKRAILSDIHSNLEALEAVLAAICQQNVEQIICLGDVIGYGPNPVECLDLAMKFDVCLLGNHEQGVLYDFEALGSTIEHNTEWTRQQLKESAGDPELAQKRWDFIADLPRFHFDGSATFVHGTIRDPLGEYVFPEDAHSIEKMEQLFSLLTGPCFQGHSHIPGAFTPDGRFISPAEQDGVFPLGNEPVMFNVGSVGQPRDRDPRASYVLQEDDTLQFCRIEYPVEKTVEKLHAISELDTFQGDRLREGC